MKDSFDSLNLDLFDRANLIICLEREFNTVLPENVFDNLVSC